MRPFWKWAIGITAGLIIILFSVNWYVNHRVKPRLEAKLKEHVLSETDGQYHLTYEGLSLSLLRGNITATDVRVESKTHQAHISRLQISGAGLLRLLIANQLHINTIVLDTPSVTLLLHPKNDTTAVDTGSKPLLEKLNEAVSRIRVKRFVLRGGQLETKEEGNAAHLQVQHINATARDIRIDSTSFRDTSRLYGAGSIDIQVQKLDYLRPDSLYFLHAGPLHFQTEGRELLVDSLHYGVTVSKAEFYRRVRQAKDIADMRVARIRLTGINGSSWVKRKLLAAEALHIDSGSIVIYKDKTQPNPPENKIGKSPHQQLLRLKQPLSIDSILFSAMDVRFTEVSDQTGKAGTVTFEQTSGIFRNVTNDSSVLTQDRYMRLHARSRVMGTGNLSVDFRFDLLDSLGAHTYTAKLAAMDGTAFNRMITPHLNVEVESAAIKGLRFEMDANDLRTKGTLQLDYDKLKVKFPVLSFFANRFLLHDSNPDANGVRHTGNVYIDRPKDFSFFKMIWRSIREGTMGVVGGQWSVVGGQ